jgi:hypothetical protein
LDFHKNFVGKKSEKIGKNRVNVLPLGVSYQINVRISCESQIT